MTPKQFLLRNGSVLSGEKTGKTDKQIVDIRLADGKISEIGPNLAARSTDNEIDAKGLVILPGLIDLHCHLRDFDECSEEDFSTGTKAAAAGGFTTVVAMANTFPPIDNRSALADALERVKSNACIEVLLAAAVTKGLAGQELTNMVQLAELGAAVFSDDGHPMTNMAVLRRALQYVSLTKRLIISHPEDKELSAGGSMHESAQATRLGLHGIPEAAEAAAIAREIEVVRQTNGRLHFAHVASAAAVNLIARAKQDGLQITADVTPHHLALTDEDVHDYDANFKTNPPLASRRDQEALVEGLLDGTIDAIATDHCPRSASSKKKTFDQCTFGVIGLETAFSIAYETLVVSHKLSLKQLVDRFTKGPATVLNRPQPSIAPGQPANLALFAIDQDWTYKVNEGFSKSRNSPFDGKTLKGKNMITFCRGELVFQNATSRQKPGCVPAR